MGNLRQVGIATLEFAEDNHGMVPTSRSSWKVTPSSGGVKMVTWARFLIDMPQPAAYPPIEASYVDGADRLMFNCPATDTGQIIPGSSLWLQASRTYGNYTVKLFQGYESSEVLNIIPFKGGSKQLYNTKRLKSPATWGMLADSTVSASSPSFGSNTHSFYGQIIMSSAGVYLIHNELANVWMPDGHVQTCDTFGLLELSNESNSKGSGLQVQVHADGRIVDYNP